MFDTLFKGVANNVTLISCAGKTLVRSWIKPRNKVCPTSGEGTETQRPATDESFNVESTKPRLEVFYTLECDRLPIYEVHTPGSGVPVTKEGGGHAA